MKRLIALLMLLVVLGSTGLQSFAYNYSYYGSQYKEEYRDYRDFTTTWASTRDFKTEVGAKHSNARPQWSYSSVGTSAYVESTPWRGGWYWDTSHWHSATSYR